MIRIFYLLLDSFICFWILPRDASGQTSITSLCFLKLNSPCVGKFLNMLNHLREADWYHDIAQNYVNIVCRNFPTFKIMWWLLKLRNLNFFAAKEWFEKISEWTASLWWSRIQNLGQGTQHILLHCPILIFSFPKFSKIQYMHEARANFIILAGAGWLASLAVAGYTAITVRKMVKTELIPAEPMSKPSPFSSLELWTWSGIFLISFVGAIFYPTVLGTSARTCLPFLLSATVLGYMVGSG